MTSSTNHTKDNQSSSQSGALRDIDSERRQALSLVHYWDHLRGERPMPIEDELDMEHDLVKHIWDQCFVVQLRDVNTGRPEFNYTYLGPTIVSAYDDELAGAEVEGMVSLNASKLMGAYQEVIDTVRPVLHTGEFDNGRGSVIKFRQCLLPLGVENVDVILGYLNYYVYAKL